MFECVDLFPLFFLFLFFLFVLGGERRGGWKESERGIFCFVFVLYDTTYVIWGRNECVVVFIVVVLEVGCVCVCLKNWCSNGPWQLRVKCDGSREIVL